MDKEQLDKPAPCPFCGGACQVSKGCTTQENWPHGDFYRVFCTVCQARQLFHRTEAEAIKAWGRRAAQPAHPIAAWMTEDGERVVPAATMEGARRDGGAMLSTMRPYTVALVRAAQPAPAVSEQADERALFGAIQSATLDASGVTLPFNVIQAAVRAALAHGASNAPAADAAFQPRVEPWMAACFGPRISADTSERNHRFFEEATELVQAGGMPKEDALTLIDYVYSRPVGELGQEVGGVMVTLAALCLANKIDMHQEAETELARIWTKVEAIRAKQATKPKHSPLPQHMDRAPAAPVAPAGWKWAPIEPTDEMREAAREVVGSGRVISGHVYRAMLAVAPAAPAPQDTGSQVHPPMGLPSRPDYSKS